MIHYDEFEPNKHCQVWSIPWYEVKVLDVLVLQLIDVLIGCALLSEIVSNLLKELAAEAEEGDYSPLICRDLSLDQSHSPVQV